MSLPTRKVLIVEDDEAARLGLHEILTNAGYEVLLAKSFEDGRWTLGAQEVDLLIADVRLGGYNGLQLLIDNPRPVPTIVITGYHDATLEAEAHRLGAEFVLKPISVPSLLSLIETMLERDRPER